MELLKTSVWRTFKEYALITLGLVIYSLGWTIFLMPNNLVGGGVSGFSAILYYATGIPMGYSYFVINVILLLIAIKIIGTGFGWKTVYAIAITSLLLNIMPNVVPLDFINAFAVSKGNGTATSSGRQNMTICPKSQGQAGTRNWR